MKYTSLARKPQKSFKVELFDGGLNLCKAPELISDNQASYCENALFTNGGLKSRKGLKIYRDSIEGGYDGFGAFERGITVTETLFEYKSQVCRLAYAVWGDSDSYAFVKMYLINPLHKILPIGGIEIHRASSDTYYRFESIVFLVGEKHSGSGVFAFLTRKDKDSEIYDIYELSSDLEEWQLLNDGDYYEPVILVNGKGTMYNTAVKEREVYSGQTAYPESFNMLTNRFKAYFTTDGSSFQFHLPVTRLSANSRIVCRVYATPSSYEEWIIPAQEESVTIISSGGKITLSCNRNTGYVSFLDETGGYYSPPNCYAMNGNNLVISAERIKASQVGCVVGSRGVKLYNSNAFFYGNKVNPDKVYCAKISKPLYFPEKTAARIGSFNNSVIAMAVQNNKLIAFTESQIYKVNINSSTQLESGYSLLGLDESVLASDSLKVTVVHESIGCLNRRTIAVCGNRLIWLGSDKRVYTLATTTYGKENNIYCVSDSVNALLSETDESELKAAFAFDAEGYYNLCIGEKMLLLDYRIKNFGISPAYTGVKKSNESVSWYLLSLPQEQSYTSGATIGDKTVIFVLDNTSGFAAAAGLEGVEDEALTATASEYTVKAAPVKLALYTKCFNMGSFGVRKNIDTVKLYMDISGSADIIINGKVFKYSQTVSKNGGIATVVLTPAIIGEYSVQVCITSLNPIAVYGLELLYRELY